VKPTILKRHSRVKAVSFSQCFGFALTLCDPDPAFQANADLDKDPDPAFQMNADPCGSGSWIYIKKQKKKLSKLKKNNVKF
jgi:hypothetical protein